MAVFASVALIAVTIAPAANAQSTGAQLDWLAGFEGTAVVTGVVVDFMDVVHVTGNFDGTVDFDPGPGQFNLTSQGGTDAFVASYTESGAFIKAFSLGGPSFATARAVVPASSGDLVVVGWFEGTMDADPGGGTLSLVSGGGLDSFIAQFSPTGDLVAAGSIGGPGTVRVEAATAEFGNLYVTGSFEGTVDVDLSPGVQSLTSAGGPDMFVAVYEGSGTLLWADAAGSTGADIGLGIAAAAGGTDVHVAGFFEESVSFAAGLDTLVSAGGRDGFVVSYNGDGELVTAGSVGGPGDDVATDVAVHLSGDFTVVGTFEGVADLDLGPAVVDGASNGGEDTFVSAYGPGHALRYAVSYGGAGDVAARAVALNSFGEAFVATQFVGSIDVDPSLGTFPLGSLGSQDAAVVRLSTTGQLMDAFSVGGSGSDLPLDIDVGFNGKPILGGLVTATADFDPGPGTATVSGSLPYTGYAAQFISGDNLALKQCDGRLVTIDMTTGASGVGTDGDDVILGTDGDDLIDAGAGEDVVCAGDGDDTVLGGDGDDTLFGGAGRDIMRGNPGVDRLIGGDGNDRLLGGTGNDTLEGGPGDDYLGGFGGDDDIKGGEGNEVIYGGFGADEITGGSGDDEIHGLVGDDSIFGGPGNDVIDGDRGNDFIAGSQGDDIIRGGNANDVLFGNDGDDNISGGKADDQLFGGRGTDTCIGNKEIVADSADADCTFIFGVP